MRPGREIEYSNNVEGIRSIRHFVQEVEVRFDRERDGSVTLRVLDACTKTFTPKEWARVVAVLSRDYTDEHYLDVLTWQFKDEPSAHAKAEFLEDLTSI